MLSATAHKKNNQISFGGKLFTMFMNGSLLIRPKKDKHYNNDCN